MIRIAAVVILFVLTPIVAWGQEPKLQGFDNLIHKTRTAEGECPDSSLFRQGVALSYGPNKTIVIANSKGFTNKDQTQYGNGNHAIRPDNGVKSKGEYGEFDIFGGFITGDVVVSEKDIHGQCISGDNIFTDD